MSPGLELEKIGWIIAESHAGHYAFQRRVRDLNGLIPKTCFPLRMNIFWSISEPDECGYASKSELERLHSFETRLIDAEEANDFSILTAVLTGRSEREFVFYTREKKEFMQRLSQMPQEPDRYPIRINSNDDPTWQYFENERKGAVTDL